MNQLVLFFVHLILLPEAREHAVPLIDRLLFGRLLDLLLKMQNLGHQLSKTFWVTAVGMWMPRPYNNFFFIGLLRHCPHFKMQEYCTRA
jgi:hypothetical protein